MSPKVTKKEFEPRRVGNIRPSQLMYTYGVGSLVDLPNFTVVVSGIDMWGIEDRLEPVIEDRLLAAVKHDLGSQITALRSPPWEPETRNPFDSWARVGIPVFPFPRWMRCPRCKLLASIDSGLFKLKVPPTRPDKARYEHNGCGSGGNPTVVPARFVVACTNGHLDEFPWVEFVHRNQACSGAPLLKAFETGTGSRSTDVRVVCATCTQDGFIGQAFGEGAAKVLPLCRGRDPHLRRYDKRGCDQQARALLLGASNAWFPVSRTVLSIPASSDPIEQLVADLWGTLEDVTDKAFLTFAVKNVPDLKKLAGFDLDKVWAAIEARREDSDAADEEAEVDLMTPEWDVLRDPENAPQSEDFTLRSAGLPVGFKDRFAQVVQVDRLREVIALTGFTRLDGPDSGVASDVEDAVTADLSNYKPTWVPAAQVRGEGIFLQLPEDTLAEWVSTVAGSDRLECLREAHQRWRLRRGLDAAANWPGERYVLLHTLSHLLINEFALECGYSAASIRERIYARDASENKPAMAGVLLYTSAPDSEGTLGGLVALGEPATFGRILRQALDRARLCGSDPHCSEHTPDDSEDVLHNAACHACLFVPETSCERGNRYLDRAVAVSTLQTLGLEYFASS